MLALHLCEGNSAEHDFRIAASSNGQKGESESMQDAHMRHVMCRAQLAVTLHSPASGRYMDLYTNMPGLQFYSGNNLNGSTVGKGAYPYPVYGGMALETQVGSSIWLLQRRLVHGNLP